MEGYARVRQGWVKRLELIEHVRLQGRLREGLGHSGGDQYGQLFLVREMAP